MHYHSNWTRRSNKAAIYWVSKDVGVATWSLFLKILPGRGETLVCVLQTIKPLLDHPAAAPACLASWISASCARIFRSDITIRLSCHSPLRSPSCIGQVRVRFCPVAWPFFQLAPESFNIWIVVGKMAEDFKFSIGGKLNKSNGLQRSWKLRFALLFQSINKTMQVNNDKLVVLAEWEQVVGDWENKKTTHVGRSVRWWFPDMLQGWVVKRQGQNKETGEGHLKVKTETKVENSKNE